MSLWRLRIWSVLEKNTNAVLFTSVKSCRMMPILSFCPTTTSLILLLVKLSKSLSLVLSSFLMKLIISFVFFSLYSSYHFTLFPVFPISYLSLSYSPFLLPSFHFSSLTLPLLFLRFSLCLSKHFSLLFVSTFPPSLIHPLELLFYATRSMFLLLLPFFPSSHSLCFLVLPVASFEVTKRATKPGIRLCGSSVVPIDHSFIE